MQMKFQKYITLFEKLFNKYSSVLVYAFILLYTILALSVSLGRFWQFQNFYYDFGVFDSAIWKVSRFQMPVINHVNFGGVDRLIFADHFNPSIFLISPLYWLTDRQEMLLVVQVLAVALAALIAYKIADKTLKNKLAVFALVFAFLGYVGMQNALISDFHEATVAVLVLMMIFWFVLKKKWLFYFISLIVLLGLKESFAGLGVGLGLMFLFRKVNLKVSILTILISILWGFVTIKYIIPYFSGGVYHFTPTKLPTNLGELINSITIPRVKLETVFYTFATFGFLPLFDISVLPAIFENFFERFVLSTYKGIDLGMHYNATLSPLLFMGALRVMHWIEKNKIHGKKLMPLIALFIIFIVLFLHRFTLRGPLALAYNPVFYQQFSGSKYVRDSIDRVPKDGLIMTHNDLAVRFTHYNIMLLELDYKKYMPDTILLNLTDGQSPNSFYPLSYTNAILLKDMLITDSNYKMEKFTDEFYLFTLIK